MKLVPIRLASLDTSLVNTDATVVFAYSGQARVDTSARKALGTSERAQLERFMKHRGFKGEVQESVYVPGRGKNLLLVAGLGKSDEVTAETLRRVMGRLQRVFGSLSVRSVSMMAPHDVALSEVECVQALAEGVELGQYVFDVYQKPKNDPLASAVIAVPSVTSELQRALKATLTISECVYFARDIQNKKSDDVYPESFAVEARAIASKYRMKITVLDERRIKKEGMNLLYAVGRGSATPPRLVLMEYRGAPKSKDVTAIVGKGITFDTGGINLKPSDPKAGMHEMHLDMSGAGVALATLKAVAELKLPVNVVGVMPLAENAIGKHAYKPGSILKAYNGVTVEVGNTDAEGRLVLADALAYVVKHYKPTRIVDFATLTGLMLYFFGYHVAGVVSNHDELAEDLFAAGEQTYERLWKLPLYDEYREDVKSKSADISNIGASFGGSITAAAFLEKFVDGTPWAHIDIAGTSMNGEGHDYRPKGGTGFGVRLMLEYFSARSRASQD